MSKLSNLFLLAIIPLTLTAILSCEDDEVMQSTETTLISFGPSGVMHGDSILIIGENLMRVNAVEFAPAERVPESEFLLREDNRFMVVVPPTAETGPIKLHTDDEVIESKTQLNFSVAYSISDVTDEARPGADITITGNFLNWIESITFSNNLTVEDFVSQSQSEIVVTVPWEASTGSLIFQGGGFEPLTVETKESLMVTLPAVTSVTPQAVRHTEEVTVTGTDLDLVKEIIFPGDTVIARQDFVSGSDETSIRVNVPATAVDGQITLVAYSDVEVAVEELIEIILPVETSLSPTPVPVGEELTITGSDLDLVASLVFPGVADPITEFVSQSATEIKVIVPEGAISGFMKFITIHDYVVNLATELELPGEGPPPLLLTVFDDNFQNGWENWGWVQVDGPSDEQVFDGSSSLKLLFNSGGDAWEGLQIGNGTPVDVSGYTNLVFYLYGGPGSNDSQVMLKVNDAGNDPGATINVVEGEWTEYSFPVSDLNAASGTDNTWSMIILQEFDQAGGDVYVDYVGFQ
ncbi:IPT/TIG domain-containing protein [Lewinella sp. IMCC34191]|uniref:IPT/TIG domain-containing protein n=1 Tax=Lewinella sp. IMCC34191 TaxID=2259172 RepID=UPI000E271660|nr:IPT/TIG domain-containing protein [Lewinella sp. IMCC34191]